MAQDMDVDQPCLEEKVAFFALLDGNDKDDELDRREVRNRHRSRRFFHKVSSSRSNSDSDSGQDSHAAPKRKSNPTAEPPPAAVVTLKGPAAGAGDQPPKFLPLVSSSTRLATRRVASAPSPAATLVKGTPAGPRVRKGPLRGLLDADASVVKETPIATSAEGSGRRASLRRSESTPVPPTKRLLGGGEASPSVAVGIKKRKRDSTVKLKPDAEQVLRGLAFFYIPNNDIAPARRLRITKAREYGAEWTQSEATATHFVVDRDLEYKDVQVFTARSSKLRPPKVVNEDYPIDCIRFKTLLDHKQAKYQIKGQPATANDNTGITALQSSSEAPIKSLQLKQPHNDRRRWDHVESRSERSTPKSPLAESMAESEMVVLNLDRISDSIRDDEAAGADREKLHGNADTEAQDTESSLPDEGTSAKNRGAAVVDELSEFIELMQTYKDLPLDADEDDAGSSHPQTTIDDSDDGTSMSNGGKTKRGSRKEVTFEDRFACNQAGGKNAHAENPNARTIEVLQQMADYYDRISDHWRTTGYRKAIRTLKNQSTRIVTEEEAFRLPSIGHRIAQKIAEIAATDRLQRLEYAESETTDQTLQLFLGIYGVGVNQAQQWIAQGFRTLEDLKAGAKLSRNQMIGVEHHQDLNTRIPRSEMDALGAVVKEAAAATDPKVKIIIGGSYRRGAESSGDIDFIVTEPNTESTAELRPFLDRLVARLEADGFLVARLASSRSAGDGSKWHGCCVLPRNRAPAGGQQQYRETWRRVDFLLVPATELGAALIYFTGNDIFNRSMRLLARKKGMRLNQRGLYKDVADTWPRGHDVTEADLIEGRDERRIFEVLGVKWREPHERWC